MAASKQEANEKIVKKTQKEKKRMNKKRQVTASMKRDHSHNIHTPWKHCLENANNLVQQ